MKDKKWRGKIEDEINSLMGRVKALEDGSPSHLCLNQNPETIELEIDCPDADIGGLHFNAQKIRNVFELKEDGNYYSRDILVHSARDTDEGTGRDLLSEYLDSIDVKQAFYRAFCNKYTAELLFKMGLKRVPDIKVSLPEANQGVKKYNGACWWYWLRPRVSGSAASFCAVSYALASAVGGCAPVFCVARRHG
ncbi:MAG: hypothetical protein LBG27_06645 [Spirochaetaceae bacterium]|jgi:hypothetical protein|nr:hypothetical protein [Spirochaetaceae bacterium]